MQSVGGTSQPEGSVCSAYSVGILSPLALLVQLRQLHPLLDTVRRPIGFRPPSDRIPFAVRSDSVRCPTTCGEEVIREDCAAIHSAFSCASFYVRKIKK